MGIVSLVVIVVVVIVAIPILVRVFREAASRNENRPGGEGEQGEPEDERGDER